MNRRSFLQMAGAGAAFTMLPGALSAETLLPAPKKLTILHTNDQHSRIEPFDSTYTRNPNQGGFARRAALIESIRKQEKNLLLLDSGDVFQGTPYFNMFGGELEFKLMSMMAYDASTMGNHDFDNGLEGFLKVLPNAKFPFITSNYDFSNTVLDGKTLKYKIFNKDGIRVGIFGLGIDFQGLVGKKQYQETKYLDPVAVAQQYSNFLKKEKKCDLIICLSHLGYRYEGENKISDLTLAPQTEHIDLILGGHTHTFLPEPVTVTNRAGKPTMINQVGWAGLLLGRIDFYFDRLKQVSRITYRNMAIDHTLDA